MLCHCSDMSVIVTRRDKALVFAGYCFLLFQDEMSVQALIDACIVDDEKFYWCVSSPTMKDKPVSVLPRMARSYKNMCLALVQSMQLSQYFVCDLPFLQSEINR